MNFYQFMSDSPWLTFFLAYLLASLIEILWKVPFRCFAIRKQGWPPVHCDSDGDSKKPESTDAKKP